MSQRDLRGLLQLYGETTLPAGHAGALPQEIPQSPPSVLEFNVTTKRGNEVKVRVELDWRKGVLLLRLLGSDSRF